jgi:hypothetical protein
MSLILSNSKPKGLTATTLPDGTIWLHVKGSKEIEIKPVVFCNFIEGFLYNFFPSVAIQEPDLIQSTCEMGVEIRNSKMEANITLEDYVCLVQYFFTNSDLLRGDPRLSVINKIVISDHVIEGNEHQKQLFNWLAKLDTHPGWNSAFYPKADIKRLA